LDKPEAEWYTTVWQILVTTDQTEDEAVTIAVLSELKCTQLLVVNAASPAWFLLNQRVIVPSFVMTVLKQRVRICHEEQMTEAPSQALIVQQDNYLMPFVTNVGVVAKSLFSPGRENKSSAVIALNKKRKRVWDFRTNPKQTMTLQVSMPNWIGL
jgi:hypothetical protein